ncbi:MAG: ATPase, T2SS/T4P/T4SS family [Nitrospiria bacterium]
MYRTLPKQEKSHRPQRLGEHLTGLGHLSQRQLHRALDEQRKSGKRLGEIVNQFKFVPEELIAQSLASLHGFKYVTPATMTIDPDLFLMIPEGLARRHMAVPIEVQNKELTVAMVDPLNYESLNDLRFYSGLIIAPVFATRKSILETIEQNYKFDTSSVEEIVKATAKDFEDSAIQVIPGLSESNLLNTDTRSLEERSSMAPVIQLANVMLSKAIKIRASDIHVEPGKAEFRVRYRVDGLLKEDMRIPKWVQNPLVSRIKVLANLDISERRLPQDGAVRVIAEGREVDLRISTLPTIHGEKVVIRILDQSKILTDVERIGLSEKDMVTVRKMINRRKGMILVTGPTGSGKTTTLYAIIQELKSETNNLTTVEDPVEYTVEGINQIQINTDVGLSFSSCLRSILRQDPNIIFVGEIRDKETAEIAFRAAMTGHLVLSTIHTNDAPSTITRLIDIGIPPYLVSSCLIGIIAQRLVRKRCFKCNASRTASGRLPENLTIEEGCNACDYTGYYGRIGAFEILPVSAKIRELISSGANDQEIRTAGIATGMSSIEEDGLEKAKQGITTTEEVARAVENEDVFKSTCAQCQRAMRIDFLICPHCGAESSYVCAGCGKFLQPEWSACPYCRQKKRRDKVF